MAGGNIFVIVNLWYKYLQLMILWFYGKFKKYKRFVNGFFSCCTFEFNFFYQYNVPLFTPTEIASNKY